VNPPVLILCGGQGTRLREETEFKPKPMVEIGGRPILWHIMKGFSTHGFTDFVLCLGYRGDRIKEFFLNYDALSRDFTVTLGPRGGVTMHGDGGEAGWSVTLVDTGEHAMTGARVLRAATRHVKADRFLVTYGDGVSDVDVGALMAFHRASGRIGTVTGVRPPARFGELIAEGDVVREFSEKPQAHEARINGGFFVFERAFLRYLDEHDGCTLEREPLERLARDEQLAIFKHDGFWQCMDTLRDLQYLDGLWRGGRAPWRKW
jgi:glucose-1-phosphate cytidylyltransferase